jgi:hypothetical protein
MVLAQMDDDAGIPTPVMMCSGKECFNRWYDSEIPSTLDERELTHGSYGEQSHCSQALKSVIQNGPNWESMDSPQREALDLIATKIARILHGDCMEPDHWHDIAGYATLVEKELTNEV